MSGSLIGALRVTLGIDTAAFEEGLGIAQKRLAQAGKNLQSVGDTMVGIGSKMSIAITAPLIAFGATAVKAATESAQAMAQVNAALASMGPVAGKTSEQLQKAAEDLQHLSTFDDDDILKSVTANMLTFGNVTGDAFDRAQQAAVNLSARLGQDLQSSAIQVGKALNDPIKGVTALQRVGVSFTQQQKDQIKAMVEVGDTAGAQAIILGELEKQFGGAAKAMRDATPGAGLTDSWNTFQEVIGAKLQPALSQVQGFLSGLLDKFNNLSPGTQSFIVGIAAAAAAIGPLLIGAGAIVSAVGSLAPVFAPIMALIGEAGLAGALGAAASAAAPFVIAGAALAGAWALFGDKIGPVLTELWDKVQAVLGPKLTGLFDTVKQVLTDLWNGPFGTMIKVVIDVLGDLLAGLMSVFGTVVIAAVSALVSAIEGGFKIVGDVLGIVGDLLTGDFSGAWTGIKKLVGDVIDTVLNILDSIVPGAKDAIVKLASGFATWFGDLVTKMLGYGRNIIDGLVRGILAAPQAVWNALKSVVMAGIDNIREFLEIKSPSRLFMEMGDFVTQGLAIGIEDGIAPVTAAMGKLGASVRDGFAAANDNAVTVVTEAMAQVGATVAETADGVEEDNDRIGQSFKQMADDTLAALQNLGQSIKGGDFLSILDSVIGLLTQLGSMGVFGGDVQANINAGKTEGRARGGPVLANHPYIVGEKRPELFVPSSSGRIEPNLGSGSRGGTSNVQVIPSQYFDVVVDGRIVRAAPGIIDGGANVAQSRIAQSQSRRLA